MFDEAYCKSAIKQMRRKGVKFDAGLTDEEVAFIEDSCGFRFPPDLRLFLQLALPVSPRGYPGEFPDWRHKPESEFSSAWEYVVEGVLGDVESLGLHRGGFWVQEWGERPESVEEAVQVAREALKAVPKLIPVHGHRRYMPVSPHAPGNPVFSIVQTDIIYYGYDFAHYLHSSFNVALPDWAAKRPNRYIDFWSDFDLPFDGSIKGKYKLEWN